MARLRLLRELSITAIAALALSACAGGSTAASDTLSAEGEGFEYGASQAEVDKITENLDPVTLTYQPEASSPDGVSAMAANMYKDEIETRSNGKIKLEVVWGQAVASFDEIDDALADGRVDIAYTAPIYHPGEYPTFDALSTVTQLNTPSPLVGELATWATMMELGWDSPELLAEFTDKGLTPLAPVVTGGDYFMACNAESDGSVLDDWNGRQIRIGGSMHENVVQSIGANPVSMAYGETFEALQRNTINCSLGQLGVASLGVYEVAPNISYLTGDQSFTGRVGSAQVAGSVWDTLPLAYQQIIFDAEAAHFAGKIRTTLDNMPLALNDAQEAGGEISSMDEEAQEAIFAAQDELLAEALDSGLLAEDVEETTVATNQKWFQRIEELGYSDGGEFPEMNEWYTPGEVDFREYGDELYEEIVLPNRPD